MTEIEAADQGASFSCQAWSRNAGLYEAIRTMPFNAELAAGVLSEARFRHYITQDAHYLVGFGRALALAAAKAPNADRIVQPEFKWSSQHLERGGCDDCSEAAFGSVWATRLALARSALCCAA